MSEFTNGQKSAFLALAKRYASNVYYIVNRGDDATIAVDTQQEAEILDAFADNICGWVFKDFPDEEGKDEDINADAQMVTFMICTIINESDFGFIRGYPKRSS